MGMSFMDSSGTDYMNLILNIAPEYVKGCELQEGEWGVVGSITNWNYVIGKDRCFHWNNCFISEVLLNYKVHLENTR